ncbi:phosphatase PAP2 family protein [Methyloceanibacter sp.]|uniref:phosphatase PAP2 family protein n=1 Tax=Methyloceanibacter sp. TaxID=1965321 RepID=UPI003D6D2C3F
MTRFRLADLTLFEQVVLAVSFVLFGVYVLDPFFLERSKALAPEARNFLRSITDIGRSNWMLIPAGSLVALALVLRRTHRGFRNAAGYGLIASTIGFVFVSVGGAGLIGNLTKYILGRARPKLFDTLGPFDFQLFSFDPDHASFPSGHATNIFALATVLGMLWPRGKVLLYTVAVWIAASRVLIGQHYFTDALGGAILGTAFPYLVRERFAARRWLFEPAPQGGYRLRGERTRNWLGWPGTSRPETAPGKARLFRNSRPDSLGIEGD